jgi:predicted phosphodiesterase
LVLGAIGGLAAGLLLPARNARRAAVGALAGLLAVTGLVAVTARDYDVKAWRQPRYSGMLTAAPWLIDTVEDKLDDFDSFRDEMRQTANNLYAFYTKVDNWESVDLGRKRLKVLHVGDVHNNPVAFDIIREIVRDFHVDLIIDTGDLTDFGTPVETGLVEKIGSLGVPYVFVAGNHDSPPVLEALKQQENVIVAEKDTVVKAAGLRVLGLPEAAAEEFSSTPEETEALRSYSGEAGRYYEGLAVTPDIVAAHEYGQIKALVGLAPAILIGHTHQPSLFVRAGTVVADVGTSGAAGIRNFEVDQDLPYSFKLLYFDDASHDLLAVDSLALSGTSRDFVLERRLIRGTKERLPKRAGSANLDLSWKTGP